MKSKFFVALLTMISAILFSGVASSADPILVSCTNLDNPSFESCTGITEEELRGLVGDLEDIEECRNNITGAVGTTDSCTVGRLSCDVTIATGDIYSATCSVDGVPATVFEIDCSAINSTTNEATCSITNEIAALADTLIDPNGNIAPELTPPELAVAATLISACSNNFSISDTLQRDCDIVIGLVANDDPIAAELIDVITPSAASAAIDSSQTSLRAQNRNISQRMNQLRRAGLAKKEEVSFNGLQLRSNGRLVDLSETYPELKSVTGGAASADNANGRLGVFVNGTVDMGDKDNSANERGFSFSGSDMTIGVDYVSSDASFIGMALGLSTSSATLNDNRGSLDNTGYNIILYASILPMKDMYLDANIVIGGNTFEQERRMVFNETDLGGNVISFDQTASASYFGDQFAASLTTGRDFVLGPLTLGPYATLQVLNSTSNAYNESMTDNNGNGIGGGFALQIDEQEYKSTTLTIGGQFSYVINMSSSVLIPQLKLEWIKEFQDGVNVVSGNFIGDPNKTKFRLPTDVPDDSYLQLGLGTTGIIPGGTTYYVFYQTYLGYDNLSQSSFNLGLRWEL